MNLHLIEHHPQKVLQALRRGEFDALEIIGEADEKEFFELIFREKILEGLAATMPTARRKHEVPLWFILAANLSLKLHLEYSFLAFERVIRCGGLLSALPPELASKRLDPASKAFHLWCQGFNQKNSYERTTPCDQDTLRKALKDVTAQKWLEWFNGPVQQSFQEHGFFDPAGVFIGDASYLFVPDNPAYEGSSVLWFDEHNRPVDYDTLSPQGRVTAHRERCYKWVSLLHLRGQQPCYVYAAAALVTGSAHECPVLYPLVDGLVKTLGKGVVKKLILDRGFIDGERISHCKRDLGIDVLIPIKKNMDLWTDAWSLGKTQPWVDITPPPPSPPPVPPNRPAMLVRREAARQKTLAQRKAQKERIEPSVHRVGVQMCPIKGFTSWTAATVPIHVLLLREQDSDGQQHEWALLTTEDFADGRRLPQDYQLRTQIEERHRQLKCFHDLTDLHSRCFHAITAQVVMILLSYSLRQYQLWKLLQTSLASCAPDQIRFRLAIRREHVVIYHNHAYTQMPLLSFSRELLQLEPQARARALEKVERLEQSMLCPLENLRPP
jgi:hypothetical protein